MGNQTSGKKDPRHLGEEEINSLMANTSFTRDEVIL